MQGVLDRLPHGVDAVVALGVLGVHLLRGTVGEVEGDLVPHLKGSRRLLVEQGVLACAALEYEIGHGALVVEVLAAGEQHIVQVGDALLEVRHSFLEFSTKLNFTAVEFSILTISVSIIATIMGNFSSGP